VSLLCANAFPSQATCEQALDKALSQHTHPSQLSCPMCAPVCLAASGCSSAINPPGSFVAQCGAFILQPGDEAAAQGVVVGDTPPAGGGVGVVAGATAGAPTGPVGGVGGCHSPYVGSNSIVLDDALLDLGSSV
jgi:hypothetical protein